MTTQTDQSSSSFSYFSVQSTWGVTKHMGGLAATNKLAEHCHISPGKTILEIGCGVGVTACHLAKEYACRVMSIDLNQRMVDWAKSRSQRRGLQDRVEFRQADAQDLPFEEDIFDAVISESVTAFVPDKQSALKEYTRVLKPDGYIGLNEGTWIKNPPPEYLVQFLNKTMAGAVFLLPEEWRKLLVEVGLKEVSQETHKMNMFRQGLDEMQGLDFQDFLNRMKAWGVFFSMLLKDPGFRQYAKEITPSRKTITDLFTYFGYGFYVGKKEILNQSGIRSDEIKNT